MKSQLSKTSTILTEKGTIVANEIVLNNIDPIDNIENEENEDKIDVTRTTREPFHPWLVEQKIIEFIINTFCIPLL